MQIQELDTNEGALYVVATPIGNLGDITKRALDTLQSVDLILAEDTRVTSKLLRNYNITTPTKSYHQHSGDNVKAEILGILSSGNNVALVTDAGTPGISDPGNELISYLVERDTNITIVPVPGPSALTVALSVSGFRSDKFVFVGFLPKKKKNKLFKWVKEGRVTFAFYESPKRILKTIDILKEHFDEDTNIVIARELTKIHETIYRGKIIDIKENLEKDTIKGEMVVVIEGK